MKGLNIFVRIISGIVFRMLSEIRNSKLNAGALMFPLLDNIKLNKKTAWNLFVPGKSITHTHTHTHTIPTPYNQYRINVNVYRLWGSCPVSGKDFLKSFSDYSILVFFYGLTM